MFPSIVSSSLSSRGFIHHTAEVFCLSRYISTSPHTHTQRHTFTRTHTHTLLCLKGRHLNTDQKWLPFPKVLVFYIMIKLIAQKLHGTMMEVPTVKVLLTN